MVLGSQGEVLDVGRTQRLVTPAIWKALLVRDEHCTFPGCRRPPVACDAHHLRHWADGGVTSLDNLALVCRTHHTTLHSTPWEIRPTRWTGDRSSSHHPSWTRSADRSATAPPREGQVAARPLAKL